MTKKRKSKKPLTVRTKRKKSSGQEVGSTPYFYNFVISLSLLTGAGMRDDI
jgi:hypothetical protein